MCLWHSLLSAVAQGNPEAVFTFVVSLAVLIAISLLLFWHLYLVGTAQVTSYGAHCHFSTTVLTLKPPA